MHIIQKSIIDLLRTADSMRYSHMVPSGIESSHFKYHLDQLIREGVVERREKGVYALTTAGEALSDTVSKRHGKPHDMPKVITYTIIEDADAFYLYRKDKKPYLGLLGPIGGKLHVGETPHAAARREVQEKLDYRVADSTFQGVADIAIFDTDQLLTHAIAYVFSEPYDVAMRSLERIEKDDIDTRKDLSPDFHELIQARAEASTPFVTSIRTSV